jgi:hypothetical protein
VIEAPASRWVRLAASATLLAGCAVDEVPVEPSWQVDVMPILAANCVRCHGYPASGFAPQYMRLDSYDAVEITGSVIDSIEGAARLANEIATRTSLKPRLPGDTDLPMPLGRRLDSYEVDVLRSWAGAADGSMKAPRGQGRPDNAPPVLSVVEVGRAGSIVTLAYELRDSDHDLVVGTLRGPTLNDQGQLVVGVVGGFVSGRDTIAIDLTGIAPGTYDLVARLDDGADIDGPDGVNDYVEISAGSLVVP